MNQVPDHKTRWRVTLSDGQTLTEGKDFTKREDSPLPFKQMLAFLEANNLTIVLLVLVTDLGTIISVPSLNHADPKSRRFDMAEKPKSYRVEHFYGQDKTASGDPTGKPDWFTIAVAVYQDYELQVWVNENNPGQVHTLVLKPNVKKE